MTPTGTALLAAILANPDEDTPRLVYADWLEENGEPERAAFIRVQIRIAGLQRDCLCGACVYLRGGGQHHNGPCAVDRERDELPDGRTRQAFLRRCERELWRAATVVPQIWGGTFIWSRGFVSRITCSWQDWRDHAAAILAAHPVLKVTLTTWPDSPSVMKLWEDRTGRKLVAGVMKELLEEIWDGIEFELPLYEWNSEGTLRVLSATGTVDANDLPRGNYRIDRAAPPIEEQPIPLDGWAIEIRQESIDYPDFNFPLVGFMRGELFRYGHERVSPEMVGREFGPVRARDRHGMLWTCRAVLTRIDPSMSMRGNGETILRAICTGEVARVGEPIPPISDLAAPTL